MLMLPDLYTRFPEDPTSSVYVLSQPLDRVRVHCSRKDDGSVLYVSLYVDGNLFRIERINPND